MSLQRIFGKPLSADEMVKKWKSDLRTQDRQLTRQLQNIAREEQKVKITLKALAKKGDQASCRSLAKELVNSRKAQDRIHTSKAQLNSVSMQLQNQLSQLKLTQSLKKSTEIMKMVNSLVKLPELQKVMMEMSSEMMKAGLIDEMVEESMEGVLEEVEEEEVDAEVDKVLQEVTSGMFGTVGKVGNLPQKEQELAVEEIDDGEMQERLQALRS